jgi:formate-dependent nitrite reductase cytochrome c552 subunit
MASRLISADHAANPAFGTRKDDGFEERTAECSICHGPIVMFYIESDGDRSGFWSGWQHRAPTP